MTAADVIREALKQPHMTPEHQLDNVVDALNVAGYYVSELPESPGNSMAGTPLWDWGDINKTSIEVDTFIRAVRLHRIDTQGLPVSPEDIRKLASELLAAAAKVAEND